MLCRADLFNGSSWLKFAPCIRSHAEGNIAISIYIYTPSQAPTQTHLSCPINNRLTQTWIPLFFSTQAKQRFHFKPKGSCTGQSSAIQPGLLIQAIIAQQLHPCRRLKRLLEESLGRRRLFTKTAGLIV